MDLSEQLKKLFPEHQESESATPEVSAVSTSFYVHQHPDLHCVFEKRKGKPTTVIKNYQGANSDFKALSSALKAKFNVGGGVSNENIVIQGNLRDAIMAYLKECGFTVKRVGG
jgi:translation initiation factor 1